MSGTPLASRVFSNTFYSIVDVLLLKVSTVLAFVLLVRLLPSEDIAAVGIASGYLIFIQYLDVGPIRVLLRDYSKLADDKTRRDELLTALFAFWGLQAIAMFLVAAVLVRFVLAPMGIEGLSLLYLAMVLDFLALTLHGWIKVVYYADFQQRVATRIGVLIGVTRFVGYGSIFFLPSLTTYSVILIVFAIGGSAVWVIAFLRRFSYRPAWHSGSPEILMRSLGSYGLWDHFNRVVIDTLFIVDLVVLSWFAGVREMSSYTIALKFASLLTLIPAQMNAALQVTSAKLTDPDERMSVINTMLKINCLLAISQFVVILIAGKWLMTLLFGQEAAAASISYAMILAGAVTVFNLTYPLIGIVNNFCSIQRAFLAVFLPGLGFGVGAYVAGGALFGALGMAWANVGAYAGLALGLGTFVAKQHRIRITWRLLTPAESRMLKQLLFGSKK